MGWSVALNDANPDPRVACVVLVDVSESMKGEALAALQEGFAAFAAQLRDDPLASKRAEVAVVTFGSVATVVVPMQEARTLQPATFRATGTTNMAAGIQLALDIIEDRKAAYKSAGLQYFRPWLMVLTDGRPNLEGFATAVVRLNAAESAKSITVFAIGVGTRVDYEELAKLSVQRSPAPLDGLKFAEFFQWLSASLTNVSNSMECARDDATLQSMQPAVDLPPISGWSTV